MAFLPSHAHSMSILYAVLHLDRHATDTYENFYYVEYNIFIEFKVCTQIDNAIFARSLETNKFRRMLLTAFAGVQDANMTDSKVLQCHLKKNKTGNGRIVRL